jgi:hypothetical protein
MWCTNVALQDEIEHGPQRGAKNLKKRDSDEPRPSHAPPTAEERQAGTKTRTEWLQSWAKEHPAASVHEAREAVKGQFDMSLGTTLVSEMMKGAREAAGLPPSRRGREPESLAKRMDVLVAELRALGVKKLEIEKDDYRAEMVMTGKRD